VEEGWQLVGSLNAVTRKEWQRMASPVHNVLVEMQRETTVRVVIDVPIEEGDTDDQTILAKAWAILAERITLEKREQAHEAVSAEEAAPAPPGNAAWWGG
jgi:hypothetical protein